MFSVLLRERDVHPTEQATIARYSQREARDESLRESNRERRRFNSRNCTLNLRYTPNRVTPANREPISDRAQRFRKKSAEEPCRFLPTAREITLGLFSDSFRPQLRPSLATAIYAIAVIPRFPSLSLLSSLSLSFSCRDASLIN